MEEIPLPLREGWARVVAGKPIILSFLESVARWEKEKSRGVRHEPSP